MNPTFLNDILNDLRFSFASVLAIWFSLFVPTMLIGGGIVALGGGWREFGAVVFAAAVFSAADWLYLVLRFADDADSIDGAELDELMDSPVLSMARFLGRRYL
jgi:hypothetical protein